MQKSCQKETQQPPKWDPQGTICPPFGCLFGEFLFHLFLGPVFGSLGSVKIVKTVILSSFFAYRPFHKKSSKWVPKSSNLGPLLDDFGSLEVTKKMHRKSHPKVFQNWSNLGEVSGVLRTPFSFKIDPGTQEGSSRPPDPPKAPKINKKGGPDT